MELTPQVRVFDGITLMLWAFLAAALLFVFYVFFLYARNWFARPQYSPARVILKRNIAPQHTDTSDEELNLDFLFNRVNNSGRFYITFETPYSRHELEVPQHVFVALEEGDEGMLVRKRDWFRQFVPSSPRLP